ncbi:MAG TPA: MFS transporter [Candidatus Binatia bacterium]|nr:MFS transporter [Candidatus Binatia bacterium]
MFQLNRYIHPGYLSHHLSREIQELYWAKSISDLATAAVMLFEPIFLVSVLGFSMQQVMYFFLAVYGIYLVILPLGAKVAAKKGYEHAILYSTLFMVLYWALLFAAQEVNFWIYLAPIALAVQKCLYWPAFYADMARFSSADQRGRENSGLYALVSIIFILGPFLGGYLLSEFGYSSLFIVATVLMLLSNLPLFSTIEQFTPKEYKYSDTLAMFKAYPKQMVGYWGFGEELTQLVIWPIFIFMTIPDFFDFGTIISISTLIATAVMLYVGVLTDRGNAKHVLIRTFSVFNAIFWFIRPYFPNFKGIVTTNTLGTIGKHSLIVPITSMTYDRANETHIMPYLVFFEQNLIIGKLLMILSVLVVLQFTTSFLPLFFLAGIFSLLFVNLK